MHAWEMGGRESGRAIRKHYYKFIDAVVFVIDSNDRERLQEAKERIEKVGFEFSFNFGNINWNLHIKTIGIEWGFTKKPSIVDLCKQARYAQCDVCFGSRKQTWTSKYQRQRMAYSSLLYDKWRWNLWGFGLVDEFDEKTIWNQIKCTMK